MSRDELLEAKARITKQEFLRENLSKDSANNQSTPPKDTSNSKDSIVCNAVKSGFEAGKFDDVLEKYFSL